MDLPTVCSGVAGAVYFGEAATVAEDVLSECVGDVCAVVFFRFGKGFFRLFFVFQIFRQVINI